MNIPKVGMSRQGRSFRTGRAMPWPLLLESRGLPRAVGIQVVDGDEGPEGSPGGLFDRLATALEAIDHGGRSDDAQPLGLDPLDRLDRRAAGRDDVVNDQAGGVGGE